MSWSLFQGKEEEEPLVDAIEEGRIIRVKESYARREGLMILRKIEVEKDEKGNPVPVGQKRKEKEKEEMFRTSVYGVNELRKPLNWSENRVVKDLVTNFQWEIGKARKIKNITRKQLADAVGEPERNIKMVENGLLPRDDFILISKIENYLGINLRRSGASYNSAAVSRIAAPAKATEAEIKQKPVSESLGDDFEVFDEN